MGFRGGGGPGGTCNCVLGIGWFKLALLNALKYSACRRVVLAVALLPFSLARPV